MRLWTRKTRSSLCYPDCSSNNKLWHRESGQFWPEGNPHWRGTRAWWGSRRWRRSSWQSWPMMSLALFLRTLGTHKFYIGSLISPIKPIHAHIPRLATTTTATTTCTLTTLTTIPSSRYTTAITTLLHTLTTHRRGSRTIPDFPLYTPYIYRPLSQCI